MSDLSLNLFQGNSKKASNNISECNYYKFRFNSKKNNITYNACIQTANFFLNVKFENLAFKKITKHLRRLTDEEIAVYDTFEEVAKEEKRLLEKAIINHNYYEGVFFEYNKINKLLFIVDEKITNEVINKMIEKFYQNDEKELKLKKINIIADNIINLYKK